MTRPRNRPTAGIVSVTIDVRIPFHDVDVMEVVWHGHYVKYFEQARCALLDKIAYNYPEMRSSGYAWPVIDMHVRYPGPARFAEVIRVTATLVEWENRLAIEYTVCNPLGARISYGRTVQVAVAIDSGEMQFASPPILAAKLAAWLPGDAR
jgi:acyl-CoA thioester hydrolase